MKDREDLPIISCSSESSRPCAISIIRLSGFQNLSDFQPFFQVDLTKCKPRYAHYSKFGDGSRFFDEILFFFFVAPKSYTGENLLELHVHGNPMNVRRIVDLFVDKNMALHARPGEFTFRAYKNKKMTLSQVEGLDLFLKASNPLALDQGLELLNGELQESYQQLYRLFIDMRASVELAIDFSDDVGLEEVQERYLSALVNFEAVLKTLAVRSHAESDLLSPHVVLYGPTNSGKSTLFNLILGIERAIVSSIEGTTRDFLSEHIVIDGTGFKLLDTAGIRETDDQIEARGIEHSERLLNRSFFKIALFNANHRLASLKNLLEQQDFDLLIITHGLSFRDSEWLQSAHPKLRVLVTDLVSNQLLSVLGPIGPDGVRGPIGPDGVRGPIGPDDVGGPIGPLLELIARKYRENTTNSPLLVERHSHVINDLTAFLEERALNLSDFNDLAVLTSEINVLGSRVADLIGLVSSEEVLNHIFSQFCIGK
jgi:tRNA modification GTPase